jgi:hypothetical protein
MWRVLGWIQQRGRRTVDSPHPCRTYGVALLGPIQPDTADRLGAFQGLDLGLLVHTEHDRACGWVQIQPDDVVDLGRELRVGGELEGLGAPRLDPVLAPDARDGVAADAKLSRQQPGRPVRNPQPWRWRIEVTCRISVWQARRTVCGRPGRGRSGNPSSPRRTYRRRQAMTVGRETPTRSATSVLVTPSAASSRIRARCTSTAGSWLDRAHRRSSARSSGAMGSGAAAGMLHGPTAHHAVKLLQRRSTRRRTGSRRSTCL